MPDLYTHTNTSLPGNYTRNPDFGRSGKNTSQHLSPLRGIFVAMTLFRRCAASWAVRLVWRCSASQVVWLGFFGTAQHLREYDFFRDCAPSWGGMTVFGTARSVVCNGVCAVGNRTPSAFDPWTILRKRHHRARAMAASNPVTKLFKINMSRSLQCCVFEKQSAPTTPPP